jgi:hypothetical protein
MATFHIAGEVILGDDKELARLQAADLLVGEVSQKLRFGVDSNILTILRGGQHEILRFDCDPPEAFGRMVNYSRQVYERRELVIGMAKFLKERGVKE